jgi:signal transduction histidine kinase
VLAEARTALLSSLDTEANLARVARLAVPALGDGCVIHLRDREGRMRLLVALHAQEERVSLLETLHRREAGGPPSEDGPWNVFRSGEAELLPNAGMHYMARSRDRKERELLESIDLGSSLSAPIVFQERLVGAITVFTSGYGRRLAGRDLAVVKELAQCAALAASYSHVVREMEKMNRIQDEILTTYAHNLRNSLGSVQIWLELLRSENLVNGPARAVSMIDRSIRNVTDLVGKLADVSRVITGRLKLDKAAIDLSDLLDGVLKSAALAAADKRVRLESEIDRSLEWFWADSPRLRQALENVVSNAIKFTPSGGVVTLTLERRGGNARIRVSDSGIGISPQLLPAVLEGFRESGSFRGGLGLAIARRIVEQHGGTIAAHSEGEGRGSLFTLDLPLETPPPSP